MNVLIGILVALIVLVIIRQGTIMSNQLYLKDLINEKINQS